MMLTLIIILRKLSKKSAIRQVKIFIQQDSKSIQNVDTDVQQYLWNVYNTDYYVSYPDSDLQVASTIIDVTNGNVIAQLGSRNQDTSVSLGTNQSVLTDRDWGSTMKPITDYAPAIEKRCLYKHWYDCLR